MTTSAHPDFPLYRTTMRVSIFILLILPGLVAFGVGLLVDFGANVKPLFFEVMAAGVLPVLLVACLVQYAVIFGRVMSAEMSASDAELVRYEHRRLTNLYGLIFLAGESLSLYAVGAGRQSTFLLLATSLYALVLLFLLLGEVHALSDSPERLLPAFYRRDEREHLKRLADERAERAADLRAETEKEDGETGG